MRVLLVSANAGKLRELRRLLPDWQLEPLPTSGIGDETGASFEANARAKVEWGRPRAAPDAAVLGEDSGLEVDALAGAPGIRSARFAGPDATDRDNLERLLAELAGVPRDARRARYICALVLIAPDGTEHVGRGTLEGSIATAESGSAGFGYDPVFVPAGESLTVGELGDAWKDEHSHRAAAVRRLVSEIG